MVEQTIKVENVEKIIEETLEKLSSNKYNWTFGEKCMMIEFAEEMKKRIKDLK